MTETTGEQPVVRPDEPPEVLAEARPETSPGAPPGARVGTPMGGSPADTAGDSFSMVFTRALQGHPCMVLGIDAAPRMLPMSDWTREADDDDLELLALCEGPTLDVGCGPGRLTSALAATGHVALGIDVVHEAVGQTRARGAAAIRRDVFAPLPGEGRWSTALLADGNIGIGGDPSLLLSRVRELLEPSGRIVVEVDPPGTRFQTVWARLECAGSTSRPFRWSTVGVDAMPPVAANAGLGVVETHRHGRRWSVVLRG